MPKASQPAIIAALLAGVFSAVLFVAVYSAGLGFLFMFLPTLPLFFSGLRHGPTVAARAAAVAALIVLLSVSSASAVVYMFVLGLPAWYLTRGLLSIVIPGSDMQPAWMPVGIPLTHMCVYAVGFVGIVTAYYADMPGGLPGMMSEHVSKNIQDLQDEYGQAMDTLARDWAFLLFPITIWLWALCLYFHAWLANRSLDRLGKAPRPSVAITPFAMPGWMLYLLAIAALASLIGSPSMQFFGKSALISLLLPYFFSGIACMHAASQRWPSRRFFLFLVYFSIVAQVWPAMLLSGVGLWQQLKNLNKHLPRGGSSSNN